MKRVFGWLAVLLGAVGVVACLAGIVFAFLFAQDATDTSTETLRSIDESLTYVDKRVEYANSIVGKLKSHVDETGALISRHLNDPVNQKKLQAKLKSVEAELTEYYESAVATLDALAIATDNLANWIAILQKTRLGQADESLLDAVSPDDAKQLAKTFRELSSLLQDFKSHVAQFRTGNESKQLANAFELIVSELSGGLGAVHSRISTFENRLGNIERDVDELEQNIPQWISTGKYIMAVVLFWMAAGQLCLLMRGLAMARKKEMPLEN